MEKIVISGVIIFMWIVYSIFEGCREAYYYDSTMRSDTHYSNIHWMYFLQRGAILLIIGFCTLSIFLPLALAFIMPFFHDGFYYITRNSLDKRIYPKRFCESSTTSTAFFELNFIDRIMSLIVGIFTLFIFYIFLIYR